jgi:hypothetical protein
LYFFNVKFINLKLTISISPLLSRQFCSFYEYFYFLFCSLYLMNIFYFPSIVYLSSFSWCRHHFCCSNKLTCGNKTEKEKNVKRRKKFVCYESQCKVNIRRKVTLIFIWKGNTLQCVLNINFFDPLYVTLFNIKALTIKVCVLQMLTNVWDNPINGKLGIEIFLSILTIDPFFLIYFYSYWMWP